MDKTLRNLQDIEERPSITNDCIPTDAYHIMQNFILDTLSPIKRRLDLKQIHGFAASLSRYITHRSTMPQRKKQKTRVQGDIDKEYITSREDFVQWVCDHDIVAKLFQVSQGNSSKAS